GDVAPGLGKARDEPGRHRVAQRVHDDRDCVGCCHGGSGGRGGGYEDDVGLEAHALSSEVWKPLATAAGNKVVDGHSLTMYVAEVAQSVKERLESWRWRLRRT